MTAFSREVIHDVTEVIVTRREVDSLGSKWDALEFDIVDENGISKTLLLFAAEGKTMSYKRKDSED
tara:strand:- start:18439 stop:18636 length:198 start_codon:yes stop_codon:yes gene_type:complete